MKIQQKLLAVLMVIVMLAAMVAPMTVSAADPADNGLEVRLEAYNSDVEVGDTLLIDIYFTGTDIKSLLVTLDYDENVFSFLPDDYDTYWGANDRSIDRAITLQTFENNVPTMTFETSQTLDNVPLLHLAFEVKEGYLAGGTKTISFGEVRYALMPAGGVETTYNNITNPELVTLEPYVVTVSCDHDYAINRYTGLMTCSVCNEVCPHDVWTSSVCEACGLECTHDWTYSGTTATCAICGAKCTSHAKKGLFLDCATCGYDMELANSYYAGNSFITDTDLTLQTAHGFSLNMQLTVGSEETIFNTKDTSRSDNVYYSGTEASGNNNIYHTLVSWVYRKSGASNDTYKGILSLWLDTTEEYTSRVNGEVPENFTEPKLWLTVVGDSSKKICEIKAGVTYDFSMYYDVASGGCVVEVSQNGVELASYGFDTSDFSGTVTMSKIRLGETAYAKKLHIQKMSFEDVIFSDTYESGSCRVCGVECAHRYNVGGYCADCGVLGDPITYNDKTGSSEFSIGGSNVGAYKSSNTSTVGIWQVFDNAETFLGHDYVLETDVKFTEAIYDSSLTNTGTTSRYVMWADANAATTTIGISRFAVYIRTFADNDQVVWLGFKDGFTSADPHVVLNLNEKHNLRIAVRSTPTATEGTYSNTAEVYFDSKLVYTQTFTLTAEDGMAIRIGDHTKRICCARSEIDSTFGIHFLDDTIEYIGSQEKENADYSADENFDIRFVFGFDDLYNQDVGVKVEAAVSDGTTGTKVLSADGKALTAVAVNGVTKKIGVNGIGYGGYYMAAAITGIELDTSKTYTFTLTPYLKGMEAEEVTYMDYSYEITVTFDENDKMVIDYEKIA